MNKSIKNVKKKKVRGSTQDQTLSAPPFNMYSAFQPGAYYRMYHRVEAEKMKNSYNWTYSEYEADKYINKRLSKRIQKTVPPIKASIKEGVLIIEIGKYNKKAKEEIPIICLSINEGMLKVIIGDDNNTNKVYIDFKGYYNLRN
ncbi:MAG: hypothetical protein ACFFG0_16135 [Candidatus Thorarchaeota archaeon]